MSVDARIQNHHNTDVPIRMSSPSINNPKLLTRGRFYGEMLVVSQFNRRP
ncbi:MAG: hypothetical protein NZO16_01965 [Deltaproteobacteria bacterium]|nr:hypothetical protein [Deltaproteobacteria bacterium]